MCYMSTVGIEPEQTWTLPTLTKFESTPLPHSDASDISHEEMLYLLCFVVSLSAFLFVCWNRRTA